MNAIKVEADPGQDIVLARKTTGPSILVELFEADNGSGKQPPPKGMRRVRPTVLALFVELDRQVDEGGRSCVVPGQELIDPVALLHEYLTGRIDAAKFQKEVFHKEKNFFEMELTRGYSIRQIQFEPGGTDVVSVVRINGTVGAAV